MLKLALPTGSLEEATFDLFNAASLAVSRSFREYRASIIVPWISEVVFMRPQMIPYFVAKGDYDAGITGRDCVSESECQVSFVMELPYSKYTPREAAVVLIASKDDPIEKASEIKPKSLILTEYPNLTRRFFEELKIEVGIVPSPGSTEAHIPRDYPYGVCVSERGLSLEANNLRVVAVILRTAPFLIASPQSMENPEKAESIHTLALLLRGAIDARDRIYLAMNVPESCLEAVLQVLPALKSPTVARLAKGDYFSVQTVISRDQLHSVAPAVLQQGAEDLIAFPLCTVIRQW